MITKHIFIVRHGHAKFEATTDFERALKDKGVEAVKQTAKFIQNQCKKHHLTLDACISSAALRTQQTAEILLQNFPAISAEFSKQLYSTHVSSWLEKIENSSANVLIIVGHNPTFSQMVSFLSGYDAYMKPANCALIKLEINEDGIINPSTLIQYHNNEKI